jgi:hypothetical protein
MSRSSERAEALNARQALSLKIAELYRLKITHHGLPEEILVHALEGYGTENLGWSSLKLKARHFCEYVSAHVSDCTIRHVVQRPLGRREPAASVSIYRLTAKPLRQTETLLGANIYTFTFWPSRLWFLSTTDPLYTTDHLHQRLAERAATKQQTLAGAQDSLSILWPTLIELGQQRRKHGRPGNVTNFITPFGDGLVFGDMQKLEMSAKIADLVAPQMIDFKDLVGVEHRLADFFSKGNLRLMAIVRTYVAGTQLKDKQRRLREILDRYVHRHRTVVQVLRDRTRLAFDGEGQYGRALYKLYSSPRPSTSDYRKALSELDAITSSEDWSSEIGRSLENRVRSVRRRV